VTGSTLARLRSELAPTAPRPPVRDRLWRVDALIEAVEQHNMAEGPEVPPPAALVRRAERLGIDLVRRRRLRGPHLAPGGLIHDALMDLAERAWRCHHHDPDLEETG
jgi:hypothetical protein